MYTNVKLAENKCTLIFLEVKCNVGVEKFEIKVKGKRNMF